MHTSYYKLIIRLVKRIPLPFAYKNIICTITVYNFWNNTFIKADTNRYDIILNIVVIK